MKRHKSASKYTIVVGIDRSDKELEVAVRAPEGSCEGETVSTRPEALEAWWNGLRKAYPGGLIAVGFEQPARALLAFFEFKENVDVYALNPSSIGGYRQSLKVSRAHTDATDAACIAGFLSLHHAELRVHQPAGPPVAALLRLPAKVGEQSHDPDQPAAGDPEGLLSRRPGPV